MNCYTHLIASFPGQPGLADTRKAEPFWILRDEGWQWHQLDQMQIIRTTLQTDNHASTSSLSFWTIYVVQNVHV